MGWGWGAWGVMGGDAVSPHAIALLSPISASPVERSMISRTPVESLHSVLSSQIRSSSLPLTSLYASDTNLTSPIQLEPTNATGGDAVSPHNPLQIIGGRRSLITSGDVAEGNAPNTKIDKSVRKGVMGGVAQQHHRR